MAGESDILLRRRGAVATIVLNRPARLNAFTLAMIDRWHAALETLRTDATCRVIVLTGAGRGFCSGADFTDMLPPDDPAAKKSALWDRVHRIPLLLEDVDKPVIAMINGPARGAGLDMALMCDLRVIAASATVAEPYVSLGMVPGDGGGYYLPRLVGVPRALELFWTGDVVDGPQAERIGLANHCVADDELEGFTYALAERIAAQPAEAVRLTKRTVMQGMRLDVRAALDLVSSHMAVVEATVESRDALLRHREPTNRRSNP